LKLTRRVRSILQIFVVFLVIFESGAYVAVTPRPHESFMELYALGATGSAYDYYPNNSTYIQVNETVRWYLGTVNEMGSIQLVDIRVRLGSPTTQAPNDTLATPSSAPLIAEYKRFILDNETWEMPFVWQILNFTKLSNGYSQLESLKINNVTYLLQDGPTCLVSTSCSFRFIIELWTWNVESAEYQIGWLSENEHRIAWLQLWFKPVPGVP